MSWVLRAGCGDRLSAVAPQMVEGVPLGLYGPRVVSRWIVAEVALVESAPFAGAALTDRGAGCWEMVF